MPCSAPPAAPEPPRPTRCCARACRCAWCCAIPPGRGLAARGAEIVQADLTDADALTRVLTGVRGAYVVSPQQYGRADLFELADRIAQTVARAAVAARVPKLVALSSVGADLASGSGWIRMNRMLEQRLSDSGIAATFCARPISWRTGRP